MSLVFIRDFQNHFEDESLYLTRFLPSFIEIIKRCLGVSDVGRAAQRLGMRHGYIGDFLIAEEEKVVTPQALGAFFFFFLVLICGGQRISYSSNVKTWSSVFAI